jgi:hypothetical protein
MANTTHTHSEGKKMGKRVSQEGRTPAAEEQTDELTLPERKKFKKGGPHFSKKNSMDDDQPTQAFERIRNDEWSTCKDTWGDIAHLLESFKRRCIWQPFYYDGECAKHLNELGFKNVVHEPNVDFFERVQDEDFLNKVDLIWDNPPYTGEGMKEKVLMAAFAAKKPFVLLLPSSVMFSNLLRDCLTEEQQKKIQVIAHRRVLVKKTGENQAAVPFKYLIWLAYDVNLERDFILA